MSAALPSGWRRGTLADVVASISTGVSVNGQDRPVRDGEMGVLKITAVLRGVFEPEHHKAVVPADRHRVACPVRGGTVLVSRSNTAELVGSSAYVSDDVPGLFLPDKLWALTASQGINPRWLGYVLADPALRPHLAGASNGTSGSMKNISQEAFLRLPTCIPPHAEQDAIVEILQDSDHAIDLAWRLRRARLQAVHLEGCRLLGFGAEQKSGGWHEGIVRDVVAAITTGVSVNAEDRPRRNDEVGVLKTSSVFTGIFDPQQHKAVVPAEADRVAAPVTGDTVLVSRMNTADLVGRSTYVPESQPGLYLPDRLWQVSTKPGFSARWFAAVVSNPAFRPHLAAIIAGTSGSMKNISRGDFLALPLPIPPLEIRERLALVFATFEREVVLLRQQEKHLRTQKAALMFRLLSGTLRVRARATEIAVRGVEAAHA